MQWEQFAELGGRIKVYRVRHQGLDFRVFMFSPAPGLVAWMCSAEADVPYGVGSINVVVPSGVGPLPENVCRTVEEAKQRAEQRIAALSES